MTNNAQSAPSVCFDRVSLNRGGNRILDNVCATAPGGGSTVLVGPNGAGKTTLLLCLIGELAYEEASAFPAARVPPARPMCRKR